MMENVKFALMLVALLIAAAGTGTFVGSTGAFEMQNREAALRYKAILQLTNAALASASTASLPGGLPPHQ